MELSNFHHFNNLNTPLHRADGRLKTILFLSTIIAATIFSHWYFVIAFFIISLVCFKSLQIPWKNLFLRLLIPFTMAWLVFLSIIFTKGSHVLTSIHLGSIHLNIYREGIDFGVLVILRIITAVSLASVLSFSTPMIEILETLRILKVPSIIIDIASMMYRYLFIIEQTAHNIRKSQISRLGGTLPWINRIKDSGKIALHVLEKSLDKSTKIYKSMLSRCYNEDINLVTFFTYPIPKKQLIILMLVEVTIIFTLILDILI
ncbi:cobalt ECF transporter T component CbiQ [Clostridium sp. cel8]|jgi:cobalt/nickel transport system permease protein|uniref:cobalt ECF transporter T component CbiQ n=1 Tax=unclassified Clostridium TaxID=2614128 RepID=UPI0015F4B02F|nr:cobalt ECF transporter T component CbiQ [Clostridium sp. cel8]MBA5851959.1 cobalt ECF transporter T component CbiQ [Clostridium sp. cel8]